MYRAFHSLLRRYRNSRRGNVAIISAIALPALVGFCGLGTETGYWYYRQVILQSAADVAAYNATVAYRSGASHDEMVNIATSYAAQTGWKSSIGSIALSNPTAIGGVATSRAVQVVLTENEPRYFTSIFASGTVPIRTRAVGQYAQGAPACMLGLDKSKNNTVQFWGNANARFVNCNIVSDSISDSSFALGGSANVTAPCVDAVGGAYVHSTLVLTSCPSVTTKSPYVKDPYATVPQPQLGSCSNGPNNGVLAAGTYCGGLTLNGTIQVQPGLIIVSGGTLKINSNSQVTGTGVTFFLTNGATLSFNGNATINLTAPTSGTYAGMLFFGDRSTPYYDETINGSASSVMTGAIYFPSQNIELLGNFSGSGGCMQVIADTIYYTGSSTFSSDCTGTGMKTVQVPGNVVLAE